MKKKNKEKDIEYYIKEYLVQYEKSIVIDINEYFNVVIKCRNNEIKYIRLGDSTWRYIKGKDVLASSWDENNKYYDAIDMLKKHTLSKIIVKIELSKSINDLNIIFEDSSILQFLSQSYVYESWVLNEDLICLPGGELTIF